MLSNCRLCDGEKLTVLMSLGELSLSGVFPETAFEKVSKGPLELVLCGDCTLVQLGETFTASEMYGDNYGYRSGLNESMVRHLRGIVAQATKVVDLAPGDLVLDIGSNDGTLLRQYPKEITSKVGIDPTSSKFREFYDSDTIVVSDFFSERNFNKVSERKAKVITSIAMLYDLEDPATFAREVGGCLAEDGVWIAEQSYMPWMVLTGSYDTICHEHLEYYSLASLSKLAELAGLKVVDASINNSNGGSIRILFAHLGSSLASTDRVREISEWEQGLDLSSPIFFEKFAAFVNEHGSKLKEIVESMKIDGRKVAALGASTKGSIVLQHSKLNSSVLECVADVNPFKFGRFMSDSDLQIVEETDQVLSESQVILVLPWHFRETFQRRLESFIAGGGIVIWPLPALVTESSEGRQVVLSLGQDSFADTPLSNTLTI